MAISAWFLAASALFHLAPALAADSKNNPADQLVALVNSNRTAHKSSSLIDNQGLGCLALEYIKAYQGQCSAVGDGKKPPDSSFADTFAPNCGVQSQSLKPITGRLIGCQTKYAQPDQAFDMLIENGRSLEILYSKNHTEVGAAVSGTDGGSPYFWCVLFSNGKANSSFVVDGGTPKSVRPGCFSGNNDDCSGAGAYRVPAWPMVAGIVVSAAYAFLL
ncbi:uncharacterized protein LOC109706818 [Ananas comosus]|uniref:Uncharacterized protein LOC109706818 n=1 Tax=Ananas comosus TaxID=4615 RepID=A0A6P5EIS8_ANACO|nr:uncharacterized protein LOC109706818 [Ananas comosus]